MTTFKVPVRITHLGGGGDAFNVFHMRVTDEADFGDAMAALDDFYDACSVLYASTTSITVGDGIIRDPYGSPTYVTYDPTIVTGTGGSSLSPTLLAIVVSWRTVAATRSGRGRTFMGPLQTDIQEADGSVDGGTLVVLRAAAAALVAASTGANGWAFGVYSFKDAVLRDFVGYTSRDRFSYLSSRRD